ncbi:MAG: methionyl-tRNA formyltransferase [Calditrichia bacterium]
MAELRIVFMGSPGFALPALNKLVEAGHQLVGVVTQPDKKRGRGGALIPTPVKARAQELGIHPILQPEKLKDEDFIRSLKSLEADLYVVVAFRILPEAVFMMPPLGSINIHPSLLPKYRGAAPLNWAIINGDKETGVSIMKISREIDAGGLLAQQRVEIAANETVGELHDRLAALGAEMLIDVIEQVREGTIKPIPQNDEAATPAPKITKEMCHLNFAQPADSVKNWIHGLSPFPAAHAEYQGKKVKIYRAEVESLQVIEDRPGTVLEANGYRLIVACQPGSLRITELQLEGKRRLTAAEFLRGVKISPGEQFQ